MFFRWEFGLWCAPKGLHVRRGHTVQSPSCLSCFRFGMGRGAPEPDPAAPQGNHAVWHHTEQRHLAQLGTTPSTAARAPTTTLKHKALSRPLPLSLRGGASFRPCLRGDDGVGGPRPWLAVGSQSTAVSADPGPTVRSFSAPPHFFAVAVPTEATVMITSPSTTPCAQGSSPPDAATKAGRAAC
jgi:hypothetical protein